MTQWIDLEYLTNILEEIDMPSAMRNMIFQKINDIDTLEAFNLYNELLYGNNYLKFAKASYDFAERTVGGPTIVLILFLLASKKTKENYKNLGIPDNVFIATMQCFSRFVNEYQQRTGEWGYSEFGWPWRQINCRLFKIGRLEFELVPEGRKDIIVDGNCVVKNGDSVIYVHIPSGGKLIHDECIKAYINAGVFFNDFFPKINIKAVLCGSWMLCTKLAELLPSESGIVRFQNDYIVFDEEINNDAIITRVFGIKKENKNEYPEKTTLQRIVKEGLLNDNDFTEGMGILKSEMFCCFKNPLQINIK